MPSLAARGVPEVADEVTWWGGGQLRASRVETIVAARLDTESTLGIRHVALSGVPNPRSQSPTEPNFDPDAEALCAAILTLVRHHRDADYVVIALDAPLECRTRPGPSPRRKALLLARFRRQLP